MKQLEVQIMGQSYLLGCPEGGEPQLREAVERVDAAMCRIRDAGKVKARDRIAVLASLNLAFDLIQSEAAAPSASPAVAEESAEPFLAPDAQWTAAARAEPGDVEEPEDPRLTQLLQRLDQALASDDHLL